MPVIGRVQLHNLNRGGAPLAPGGSVVLNPSVKQARLEAMLEGITRTTDISVENVIPGADEAVEAVKNVDVERITKDRTVPVKANLNSRLNNVFAEIPVVLVKAAQNGKSFAEATTEILAKIDNLPLSAAQKEAAKKLTEAEIAEVAIRVITTFLGFFGGELPVDTDWGTVLKSIEQKKRQGIKVEGLKTVTATQYTIKLSDGTEEPAGRWICFRRHLEQLRRLAESLGRDEFIQQQLAAKERQRTLTHFEREMIIELSGDFWDAVHAQ